MRALLFQVSCLLKSGGSSTKKMNTLSFQEVCLKKRACVSTVRTHPLRFQVVHFKIIDVMFWRNCLENYSQGVHMLPL